MKNVFLVNKSPLAFLLVVATIFLSCEIFSPRDSQQPLLEARTDPLNFSAIMNGTGYQFAKLQYEDLFSEGLIYTDINSSASFKAQLINQLRLIQRQEPDIQVLWTTGTNIWKPNDTIHLNGLKYHVYITHDIASGVPDDSGSSDFIVTRENADWRICMWRDYPARLGRSFFSPP